MAAARVPPVDGASTHQALDVGVVRADEAAAQTEARAEHAIPCLVLLRRLGATFALEAADFDPAFSRSGSI